MLVLSPCCMCIAASISLTLLQWRHCFCSTGVGPFVAMVPAQSQHHLQCIEVCCIISCLFHHIAVLGKFAHSCNVAHIGGWPSWAKSLSLAKLPSWQVCPPGSLAVMEILQSLANFPCPPRCCLVIVLFCGEVAFPDNLASLDEGGNRVAFCAGMALFVVLAPAQSQCRLQCIVIRCVIILVVLLSVPLSPYQVSS